MLHKANQIPTWDVLASAIKEHFGPSQYDSPCAQLFKLTQTTSAADYYHQFTVMANRVEGFSSEALLDCFLSGLKDHIRRDIIAQEPKSLIHADPLNWLFRAELFFTYYDTSDVQRITIASVHFKEALLDCFLSGLKDHIRRDIIAQEPKSLIHAEKGLCFTCDDKFTWNHKCSNKQALILMTTNDDSDFTSLIETSEEQVNVTPVSQETIEPHLSLNAYHGSNGVATIRLSGSINGIKVQVILDGGISDNFIQPWVTKYVRLLIEPTETFRVMVGSGTFLQVEGLISSISLYVQNELIQFAAYVLPISGADIILGAAWLATLGPHIVDYSSATIKFYFDDKFITLTVFAVPTGLSPSRSQDHSIVLQDGVNVDKVCPYRYLVIQKAQIEAMVADMLAQGLIQPSSIPFLALVLFVRKKDGTWRFCTDYHALNAVTIKDSFLVPTVDKQLDELHGLQFFSKLDLRSGYHQILLKPKDRYKTAFCTHHGLYEWLVMPFGLTNAPATFQALMNDVFCLYLLKFVLIFFDDILVYSFTCGYKRMNQLLRHVNKLYKPFIVETDASGNGIGAILSQAGHSIAFFPKKLSRKMQEASTYVRELFAITEVVARFHHYLFGHYFIIRTNHHSLHHICDQTIQTPEQQALLPKLIGYNFRVEYKVGTSNGGADGLLRCFNFSLSTSHANIAEDIRNALATSSLISSIISQVEKDPVVMSKYEVKNGFLYWKNRLVIPPESLDLITKLLVEFHSSTLGGHAVFLRTYARCCLPFPSLIKCGRMLQWTLSGLPNSRGYTVIMVVIDRLSKYAHFAPLHAQFTAPQVATLFVQTVVKLHGIP
nr:hypothetical protein [Tanacetum cinerariifolium]